MLFKRPKREFVRCNFHDEDHQQQCVELLQEYMRDPMGGEQEPNADHAMRLMQGLKTHPGAFILFVKEGNMYAGLTTYFVNFSTFRAKPYINIHDVIVRKEYRGKGLGRALLEHLIALAQEQGYCKVTLEVREDNIAAQKLYQSLGFEDTYTPMLFWTKTL